MSECECDLGYYCGNHTDCPLCGRDMPDVDQSESPKLCSVCEKTAKAHAALETAHKEWVADGCPD